MYSTGFRSWQVAVWVLVAASLGAHDTGHPPPPTAPPAAVPLKLEPALKGPVRRVAPATPGARLTGQGYWRFEAVPSMAQPPESTRPHWRGAHGTIVVDAPRDTVYWGLENVGWVAFSNRMSTSWVVAGDPALARGNLHGADLLPRRGQLPLVVAADNVEGEVYLADSAFQKADKLDWPTGGPYSAKDEFHPTDAAFVDARTVYVTDGYGKAYFMPADLEPLAYQGVFHGGKETSQTPHGITYDARDRSLWVAARPEAQVKHWSIRDRRWLEVQGLPSGSTVCDVDLWGDYALAPCLDGPDRSPGPIYILDLKRRVIASVLKPKEDLGFTDAQHIHDAAWYTVKNGRQQEVYVIFTNWNPGGIGVLRLVKP